ncbi:Glycosyl hydrolases family 28 [Granulicella pectinivorans]|uniref:Glycosyl hydrolases family 28 n=2 Tax=Granulicella pectinivorans TaxID=474950 RepID=A0A1I6LVF3_9BACT|nr:Glycosyl hydrolases family 28 [Granulicella pectinivorans]
MTHPIWPRRKFLETTGKGLATLPFMASLPLPAEAQKPRKPTESHEPTGPAVHLNVRDLGALGDGKTKDTLALQQALDRCSVFGGGEVVVPAGDYLTGALLLHSNTTLRLEDGATLLGSPDIADYPMTQVRWEGRWIKGYGAFLSAQNAENVTILGKGNVTASPAIKGRIRNADGSPFVYSRQPGASNLARQDIIRNPALMEFTHCKNLLVQDIVTQGNDMWSIHPVYCENVTFKNVIIRSGADGIDVDSCRHVVIDGCQFDTRDDCISLKSGRGMEGNTIAVPCEDVRISNCTFTDATWACIGIGSETSGGIRNVLVEHCKCLGARTHAIYIKSRPGRGAFIENITMNDLEVSNAKLGFLRLNFLNSGLQDPYPVPGLDGIPTVRNYTFTNIRVTDVPVLVTANEIHPDKPLDGLTIRNVTGTCEKGLLLANMKNVHLSQIKVTGFTGPLISTYKVTGTGLTGAAPLEAPKVSGLIAAPATPYVLGQK